MGNGSEVNPLVRIQKWGIRHVEGDAG